MKKTLFRCLAIAVLLVANLSTKQSFAEDITVQKARQVATYYMGVQSSKNLTTSDLKLVYEIPNVAKGVTALYFFNTSNGGFVVVSGSDCMDPIVAYSTEGTFDPNNMPPAMKWFLNGYVETIVDAQNNDLTPAPAIQATWDELIYEKLDASQPKTIYKTMKSVWNQDAPFNMFSPIVDGVRCPTGCVATAMAQIIKFWEYPVCPKGLVSYDWNGNTMAINLDTVRYDYSLMPDTAFRGNSYNTWWNEAQIVEVSRLNYHLGIVNRMNYGSDGSGAYSNRYTKNAFKNNYKYASSIKEIDRASNTFANYSGTPNAHDTLWLDTLAREIREGRPVFYTGHDGSSTGVHAGHAFVLERYNTVSKKGWFNWGWGGSGDCWCNIITSSLKTNGYNFSDSHFAIIGIQPPKDTLNARNVAIQEVAPIELLAAYPNPSKTWVTIPYVLNNENSALLQIFSIDGRLIEERQVYAADNRTSINVSSYPKGIYIYRMNGIARKFVVE